MKSVGWLFVFLLAGSSGWAGDPAQFGAGEVSAPVKPDSTNVVEELPNNWPRLSLRLDAELIETNATGLVFGLKPSGIILDAVASKKPLDFINPKAPPDAGNGEAYLSRDPITNRPMGLNFFSFDFQCNRRK